MNTAKIKHPNTKMIAHRGLSGIETENSIAAFIAAGNRSYYGIETDVHVTADGKYVIIHDDNAVRVTGIDINIESSTLEQLQQLSLYQPGTIATRSDLKLPTLDEYISICKKYEKVAVLELKNHMQPQDIKGIIDVIDSLDYLDGTVFISFDWDNLVTVRELLEGQQIQFLTGECTDELIEKLVQHRFGLDILFTSMNKQLADKLHARGVEINCWTVDGTADGEALCDLGVDYITSNILE